MNARCLLAVPLALVCAAPAMAEPYSDPNGRYAIEFPKGWEVKPDPSFPQIMVAAPPKGSLEAAFQQNIGLQPFPPVIKVVAADFATGMTLDRYVQSSMIMYKDIWKVRERGMVKLPAGQAYRLVLDQDLSAMDARLKDQKTSLLKVFLADEEHVFVLTCASLPGTFPKVLPAYEAAVRSFKILPPAPAGTLRSLAAPGFGLSYPASWTGTTGQLGLAAMLTRKVGQDKASVMVLYDAEQTARQLAEGERQKPIKREDVTLGGRPALRLTYRDADGLYSFWQAYVVAAPKGAYQVRVTFDGEDRPPPAEVLAEIDALLASWKWE